MIENSVRLFFRAVRNAALTLFAFAAVCWGLHRFIDIEIPEVSTKLRWFAQHKDDYDTIFIGSSRINHGIIPPDFDAIAKSHGLEISSFNFGIDAMPVPESYFFIEKILSMHPARLKRIFIEITPMLRVTGHPGPPSLRDVYWHDVKRTWQQCRNVLFSRRKDGRDHFIPPKAWPSAWPMVWANVGLMLRNYSNLGTSPYFRRKDPARMRRLQEKWIGASHGYSALPDKPISDLERTRLREAVKETSAPNRPVKQATGTLQQITREIIARIHAVGAEAFFMTAPWPEGKFDYFPGWKNPPPFFSYTIPSRYPELYREEDRVDSVHVNDAGAKKFTRVFAEEFSTFELSHRKKN